jgi:hypothetical protein
MKIGEKIKSLDRQQVRYMLYRLKNGRAETTDVYKQLIDCISSQPGFDGWEHFSETWDVATDTPLKVVKRRFTMEEEWDSIVRQHVTFIR